MPPGTTFEHHRELPKPTLAVQPHAACESVPSSSSSDARASWDVPRFIAPPSSPGGDARVLLDVPRIAAPPILQPRTARRYRRSGVAVAAHAWWRLVAPRQRVQPLGGGPSSRRPRGRRGAVPASRVSSRSSGIAAARGCALLDRLTVQRPLPRRPGARRGRRGPCPTPPRSATTRTAFERDRL